MTSSTDIRTRIVELFRRNLIGPGPGDSDLRNSRSTNRNSISTAQTNS